jgi:hypothetical protein
LIDTAKRGSWLAALATRMNATWGEVLDVVLPIGANGIASGHRERCAPQAWATQSGKVFRPQRESAVVKSTR